MDLIVPTYLCLILTVLVFRCESTVVNGTVYVKNGTFFFRRGIVDKVGVAYGQLTNTLNATGWTTLDIYAGSQSGLSDNTPMFAAGYLEGILTANLITTHRDNIRSFWFKGKSANYSEEIENWLLTQHKWARKFANSNDKTAKLLSYALSQFDGILEGVQSVVGSNAFTKVDLLILQAGGDLIDIINIINSKKPNSSLYHQQFFSLLLNNRCSALVKLTPGLENLIMSHATWFTYSSTLRVYKHYYLNLTGKDVKTQKMSFSSYPGILVSLDDFYILGSKMVILQTTNSIFNKSLYQLSSTSSLLAWQRALIANRGSDTGNEWASYFSQHNSGTYNNQYMVIDLKRVHLNERIDDKALTIVEQIPGLVEYSDQTPILRNGHWPSYNVPFHEKIYNLSGYPDFVRQHGTEFSYQMAPRAKLFRRDAGKVASIEDMKRLMRSNNYKHDPYSHGNPAAAICARGDLSTGSPAADGCYDGKVADVHMALNMQSTAISGPTTAGGTLPPFTWSAKPFASQPHKGLPNTYNFNWTTMRPLLW